MMMKKYLKQLEAWGTDWKSNNFFQARIKLTFLYLLIITGILILFSVMITFQIEKNLQYQFQNIQLSKEDIKKKVENRYPNRSIQNIDLENENGKLLYTVLFDDSLEVNVNSINGKILSKEESPENFTNLITSDVQDSLWIINLIILLISSFLGYFLAGKTLAPIEKKTKQQKQFIADAAHELRNPLTAIFATCESMIREKKKEGFEEILEESARLIALTEDLLILDKAETERTTSDLATVAQRVVKKIKPLANAQQIDIKSDLNTFKINATTQEMERVVFNLLHNAIKFSPKNTEIVLTLTSKGILRVKDNGIGINAKDLPHIFDRFYKADNARTFDAQSGSGLGLAIVKKTVDKYGGKITVQSESQKGTIISIQF